MCCGKLSLLIVFILPVIAAVVYQYVVFAGDRAPPSDYGSGSMFDLIANRYDTINRVLALGMDIGWRKAMIKTLDERLSAEAPALWLDVATGTADVAILTAQHNSQAKVIGVDPSSNMLQVGRQKIKQRGLTERVSLARVDAQQLVASPLLEPQTFDAATMSFGIRNVPDRNQALCQIHALLKHDAVFGILEFSEPSAEFGVLGKIATLFIRHIIPILGGVLSGKPREYWHLQQSIQDFPSPLEFGQQMTQLACPTGQFVLQEIVQMNHGSVQLYVLTALQNEVETAGS